MIDESCFDDLDRKFFHLSSWMAGIFSETYGKLGYRLIGPIDPNKFDNASSKTKEIGTRMLIVLGGATSFYFAGIYVLAAAVVLSAGSKLCKKVGFALQKEGFTHLRGKALETSLAEGQATVLTWNVRGHGGGLHYAEGGVVHWKSRVDRIAEKIKEENPDILVLQEVYDPSLVEALFAKLGDTYAHFYAYAGESGCMIISKCAVDRFQSADFEKSDSKVKRGFGILEIKATPSDLVPCVRIIGTQLSTGKDARSIRMAQMAQIADTLAKEKLPLPTIFVGSMGVDRDSKEGEEYLSNYLSPSYRDNQPTQTRKLAEQWKAIYAGQEESVDNISLFKREGSDGKIFPVLEKGVRLDDSHIGGGFDKSYDTQKALSDHHYVSALFNGLEVRSK